MIRGGGVNSYNVTIYASTDGSSTTVKADEGTVFSDLLSSKSITPRSAVSSRALSSSGQYTFEEWSLADWSEYATSSKITGNITIYAIFIDNTQSSIDADITTGTSIVVKAYLRGDISTKKETTTTVTNADGSTEVTTVIEIENADGTSSETTSVAKTANGTTTTTTREVETAADGTTTTTTTDETGNQTTTTTSSYTDYIEQGIENLQNEKFDQALVSFNKAYALEANDETRVYSALASLASIAKNSKVATFFSEHLGITNYPSSLNALVSGNWLEAATYDDYETFAKLALPDWFKNSPFSNDVELLILANILEGNTSGLNSAIDDLYAILFGTEYADACSKIDAITGAVTLSDVTVSAFALDELWGNDTVTIGKAELKLIESALNLIKGTFEYVQSLQLNTPLSYFKFDWSDEDAAYSTAKANLSKYNASLDPLANGFLGTRNEAKLTASKATFVSVCDDLIAAYDSILADSSTYPTAAKDVLKEYKVFRTAAVALKVAINDGGKFAIPSFDNNWEEGQDSNGNYYYNELPSEFDLAVESGEWPEYEDGDLGIDFGALFTKDVWKLGKLSESDDRMMFQTTNGVLSFTLGKTSWNYYTDSYKVSGGTSSFTYYAADFERKTVTLHSASDTSKTTSTLNSAVTDEVKALATAAYVADDYETNLSYVIFLRIRTDRLTPFLGVDWASLFEDTDIATGRHTKTLESGEREVDYYYILVPMPVRAGLWLYNFYTDGSILTELNAGLASLQ